MKNKALLGALIVSLASKFTHIESNSHDIRRVSQKRKKADSPCWLSPMGEGAKRAAKPYNTSKEKARRMRQIKNQLAKLEAKQENP